MSLWTPFCEHAARCPEYEQIRTERKAALESQEKYKGRTADALMMTVEFLDGSQEIFFVQPETTAKSLLEEFRSEETLCECCMKTTTLVLLKSDLSGPLEDSDVREGQFCRLRLQDEQGKLIEKLFIADDACE